MGKKGSYQPPYTLSPTILQRVAEISELIGRYSAASEERPSPRLRRENRIRTIQASLAIENNTLTLEQVTAVLDGKPVLGNPIEIQEVRNAFAAYEAMERWQATAVKHLLEAHKLLMAGLVDEAGRFRSGGVGIFRGEQLVHMAPPAKRVPELVGNLLDWLERGEVHPLVAGGIVHYELEFIHPFADGNGRIGRLWQTLILRQWKPVLAFLPVESVIRDRQADYYEVLSKADKQGDATPFVEFILSALLDAIREATSIDQVSDQVSDQVARLIGALSLNTLGASELMEELLLSHRPTFRKNYLNPALEAGWIERTQPDAPRSPSQRYRLTKEGRRWLDRKGGK